MKLRSPRKPPPSTVKSFSFLDLLLFSSASNFANNLPEAPFPWSAILIAHRAALDSSISVCSLFEGNENPVSDGDFIQDHGLPGARCQSITVLPSFFKRYYCRSLDGVSCGSQARSAIVGVIKAFDLIGGPDMKTRSVCEQIGPCQDLTVHLFKELTCLMQPVSCKRCSNFQCKNPCKD